MTFEMRQKPDGDFYVCFTVGGVACALSGTDLAVTILDAALMAQGQIEKMKDEEADGE